MITNQLCWTRDATGEVGLAVNQTVTRPTTLTDVFSRPFPPLRRKIRACKGNVLITGRGSGGLVGHAAIMATDNKVLEMPGGEGWQNGIEDNNRLISLGNWLDLHERDRITLYRNEDTSVAHAAANWAYKNYYNQNEGSEKTEHTTYRLTPDVWGRNPSYCSKLVIQAYHFGSGDRDVIKNVFPLDTGYIVPTTLPTYFKSPYRLNIVTILSLIDDIVNYFTYE